MSKETKQTLREERDRLYQQIRLLQEQNDRLIRQADIQFLNSSHYRDLQEQLQFYRTYCQLLERWLTSRESRNETFVSIIRNQMP